MIAIGEALEFLLRHLDLIDAIRRALDSGATKEDVLKGIERTIVAASDEQMRRELPP